MSLGNFINNDIRLFSENQLRYELVRPLKFREMKSLGNKWPQISGEGVTQHKGARQPGVFLLHGKRRLLAIGNKWQFGVVLYVRSELANHLDSGAGLRQLRAQTKHLGQI